MRRSPLTNRQAFYDALIAHGAPLVREERMQAFRVGLIDEQGYVIDRSRRSGN